MTHVPAQLSAVILGCEGTHLSAREKAFFADANPIGFILFARNIATTEQTRALTSDLRDAVGWNAPILIDQEGGRVQRYRAPIGRDWLPPLDFVDLAGPQAARAMYLRARLIADELMALGIDVNCAPMLDIAREATHPFLKNRCYGRDLETVVAMGQEVARGFGDGGVLGVIKHIPGHGSAQIDSHLDVPRITEAKTALQDVDFAAFKPFANAPLGMTAHLVFEDIDPEPATVSPPMITLIRSEIGFAGLLMTDDISMEALNGTVAERAAASLAAGCDCVLHCNGDLAEMQSLMPECGALSPDGQRRASAAFSQRPAVQEIDIQAVEAELEALLPRAPG